MKSYGAISPDQIIDLFEMRARLADSERAISVDDCEAMTANAEAATWRAAADILRNTEFVGWHNASPAEPVAVLKPKA